MAALVITRFCLTRQNPEIYLLVDIADRGIRGRGRAKVIDDPDYMVKITTRNLVRYTGSLDSLETRERMEIAKKYYYYYYYYYSVMGNTSFHGNLENMIERNYYYYHHVKISTEFERLKKM